MLEYIEYKNNYLIRSLMDMERFFYLKPILEDGPQFHDKFSFMEEPPQILSYDVFTLNESQYADMRNKYECFLTLDIRGYAVTSIGTIIPTHFSLDEVLDNKLIEMAKFESGKAL